MRTSTAIVLAALSVLLVAGCGKKKSSTTTKATKTTKTTRTTRRRRPKTDPTVTTAPTTFTIKVADKDARTKAANTVCGNIAADRKKRIEGLVHVLLTGTVLDKVKVAGKLGELCDTMAVPFLMTRIAQDPSRDVKLACIAALGHIADPAASPVLIKLLDDEDLGLAMAALDALSEMTEGNYAFVNGTTVKIRKSEQAKWAAKQKEGFFKKLEKK